MPRNRKLFVNKTVLFVTSRVEEGLPFVALSFVNLIIWGILARARKRYQVKVCHFIFMANHLHLLIVVDDPDDVAAFMRYIKVETSHAINRLLGRQKRTLWCDGYDSPIVLTVEDVQRYITYIYLNPLKARLVRRVSDYPGVSSWELYRSTSRKVNCRAIARDSITRVPRRSLNHLEQLRIAEALVAEAQEVEFVLEPDAWVECFVAPTKTGTLDAARLNNSILREVSNAEAKLAPAKVLGRKALQVEIINRSYSPKSFARRMICLCSDVEIRKEFITWYKGLQQRANEVFLRWKQGDFTAKLPTGFLAPGNYRLTNLIASGLMA